MPPLQWQHNMPNGKLSAVEGTVEVTLVRHTLVQRAQSSHSTTCLNLADNISSTHLQHMQMKHLEKF